MQPPASSRRRPTRDGPCRSLRREVDTANLARRPARKDSGGTRCDTGEPFGRPGNDSVPPPRPGPALEGARTHSWEAAWAQPRSPGRGTRPDARASHPFSYVRSDFGPESSFLRWAQHTQLTGQRAAGPTSPWPWCARTWPRRPAALGAAQGPRRARDPSPALAGSSGDSR